MIALDCISIMSMPMHFLELVYQTTAACVRRNIAQHCLIIHFKSDRQAFLDASFDVTTSCPLTPARPAPGTVDQKNPLQSWSSKM